MEKELAKAVAAMREVEEEMKRKKVASGEVKALLAALDAIKLEAAQLEAEQKHLLQRIGHLDNQVRPYTLDPRAGGSPAGG